MTLLAFRAGAGPCNNFKSFHDKTPARPKTNVISLIPNNIDIVININLVSLFGVRLKKLGRHYI
jgi:hypothetical protein